jgi:hypothetical protein
MANLKWKMENGKPVNAKSDPTLPRFSFPVSHFRFVIFRVRAR